MGTAINIATLLPGRNYAVDAAGNITDLTRKYQVLRAPHSAAATLEVTGVTGLPALGAAHPNDARLLVSGYRVSEDENGLRWVVEVSYTAAADSSNVINRPPRGSAEVSRGWDSQDISVDLTHDAETGMPVLNAAGDPFENVPQVSKSLPVFKLVKKENTDVSTRLAYSGTYNSEAITIDGVAIAKHCGRLTVNHRKLYNDPDRYASEFTYQVAVMSNKVKVGGTVVDIGWDKAHAETGLFYLEITEETEKKRAMIDDAETHEPRPSETPILLAADGSRLAEGADPVNKVVKSMTEASWSSWLT